MYSKNLIPKISFQKNYQNGDFLFENVASGNPSLVYVPANWLNAMPRLWQQMSFSSPP
jgi:hypothetical protein